MAIIIKPDVHTLRAIMKSQPAGGSRLNSQADPCVETDIIMRYHKNR